LDASRVEVLQSAALPSGCFLPCGRFNWCCPKARTEKAVDEIIVAFRVIDPGPDLSACRRSRRLGAWKLGRWIAAIPHLPRVQVLAEPLDFFVVGFVPIPRTEMVETGQKGSVGRAEVISPGRESVQRVIEQMPVGRIAGPRPIDRRPARRAVGYGYARTLDRLPRYCSEGRPTFFTTARMGWIASNVK